MLEITPVRAFEDNYIWMIAAPGSDIALVVDPGDETPVLEWLQAHGKRLGAILITHHHYDHTGGIPELIQAYPGIPVYGPARESIRGLTHPLKEGERVAISGCESSLQVLEVPGHTAGHIAYYGEGALFCGDTLFAGGCGRVFDGTFEQLASSLRRIAQLPPETLIYCAHEYTLDNLGFASWVEPKSEALRQRIIQEQKQREAGLPTLPSRLALELQTNPFLRTSVPSVKGMIEKAADTSLANDTAVFTALRQWKDKEYD
ncbi:MAG: hydroxyacylglutathione hydrolase [Candidatus Thiodiazotropha sp.]